MFIGATAALLVAMALVLYRAFAGPTLFDRVLSANSFGTKIVLLIGLLGFLTDRPEFLDIALLYALVNFHRNDCNTQIFSISQYGPL